MHKIAFVIPYYGKFPNYFQLFLNSCKYNASIDFYIFTDIKDDYIFPDNVKVIDLSFKELCNLIQSKYDFHIELKTPYKICDFRPAFGEIFSEYLKDYDFWGHCDFDLIFGKISDFITEDILTSYDKIGFLGHLTLYRNISEINSLYKSSYNGKMPFINVFSTEQNCFFDEWGDGSINKLALNQDINLYPFADFFDIFPYDNTFKRVVSNIDKKTSNCQTHVDFKHSFILWNNGELSEYKTNRRYAYVHIQKRPMQINCNIDENNILIYPNAFCEHKNNKIPFSILLKTTLRNIFNTNRFKHSFNKLKYNLIEKTGTFRHKFKQRKG